MRGRLQRKLNNKSGFTLAETLVALAISIILLAITMVGILHYYKNMKLTEMDNTAKEIFIAAQNHLTAADASGELKRYREKALDESKTSEDERRHALGTLMSEPSDVPDGIDWPADNREYYYVDYNIPSGITGNLEGSILQYMLPFGAIDETVRADGKYIVEYNVETATVYGVFYAEEDVDFSYLDITWLNNNGGRTDDANGRHTRRDYDKGIIGYYGGAMADLLPSAPTDELTMEILNQDTLKIIVKDFNYFKKATDGTTAQTHITLTVEGVDSKNIEKFSLELSENAADPKKKNEKAQKWWTVEKKKTADKEAIDYLEYTIILDDITRPGGHFADICQTLIPGEDIIVKAVSESSSTLATVREAQGMTNSLFEAVTKDSNEQVKESTASIGFLRHFENLDNGVSNVPNNRSAVKINGKTAYTPEYLVTKAVQTKNMYWKEFFGKDKVNKSIYQKGKSETATSGKLASESFYGIKRDLLKEYDGQNHKISDVYIKNTNPDSDTDNSDYGKVSAGLFRYCVVDFKVKDLTLENFDVTTQRNAAALIGEMKSGSKSSNLEVSNVLVVGGSITSEYARGNAGGLIGYCDANLSITNCAVNTKVRANGSRLRIDYAGDAGGMIGEIKGSGRKIKITNSYTGGQTVNGEYKSDTTEDYNVYGVDTAGGLIGKLNGGANTQITNCYSTCSVYNADRKNYEVIGCAGGLVGKQRTGSAKYKNCYTTGLISGDTGAAVGAFIGTCTKEDSFEECYFLKGINPEEMASASVYESLESIKSLSKDAMPKTTGVVATHPMDETLENYPFETVNSTGLLLDDSAGATGVHYGDWQIPDEDVQPGELMFAYTETDKAGKQYWYIVKAKQNKIGEIKYSVFYDDLSKEEKTYITDRYKYGFLWSGDGNLQSQFNDKDFKDYVNKGNSVIIEGKEYEFYELKSDPTRDSNGIAVTPKPQDSKDPWIVFHYNPDFGASIGAEEDLGTTKKPYQVRTNQQLRNIAKTKYENVYNQNIFKQSVDIKLTDDAFKAFGGDAFNGRYDAYKRGGGGYDIYNLQQSSSHGANMKPGLITEIGATAKVSYVNLHGFIDSDNLQEKNIGSFSGTLRGILVACNSDVTINVDESGEKTEKQVGGLIGEVGVGAVISGCRYKSLDVNLDAIGMHVACSTPKSLSIGGIAGYSAGTISNSSSDVRITTVMTQAHETPEIFCGGLIGEMGSGNADACWSKVKFVKQGVGDISGGFVGRIKGSSSITNSYAVDTGNGLTYADGVFAGTTGELIGESGSITSCHAVQLDTWGNIQKCSKPFVGIEPKQAKITSCYMYKDGSSTEEGVTYISTPENYKKFDVLKGLSNAIWTMKYQYQYPVLIANPESSTSKAKAQSIFKRSLEENLQPKLDIDNEPFQELDNAG